MRGIALSIGIGRDYIGVSLSEDGRTLEQGAYRGSDYCQVLRVLALYINKLKYSVSMDVCLTVEINSKVVLRWFDDFFAPAPYTGYFDDVIESLQVLPIQYSVVCCDRPKALRFASKEFVVKEKITRLEL